MIAVGHAVGAARGPVTFYAFHVVAAPSFAVLGVTMLHRRPGNLIGRLFVAIGLSSAVTVMAASYDRHGWPAWIEQWSMPVSVGLLPFVVLVFPDGRLPSARWRPVRWAAGLGLVVTVIGLAWATRVAPGSLLDLSAPVPTSAESAFQVALAGLALLAVAALAAVGSLVVRWRRAGGEVRLQVKALACGAVPLAVGVPLDFFFGLPMLWLTLGAALPAAVAAAVLRYRLYDIDLILNRSLVYSALTLLVVGAYVAVVAVVAPLLGAVDDGASPIFASAVVALVFQPARAQLQRGINHLLYGHRDDPYHVLSRLRMRLEQVVDPVSTLPEVTHGITEALRVPYAAIELADAGAAASTGADTPSTRPVASHGRPDIAPEAFPMTYQRQVVGRLLVSPRSAASPFTRAERQLLRDLAAQAGMAAYNVRLTTALRRSRERLVRSREEERRRLRRELHDGLGPALAGMMMQVGAAHAVLTGTPPGDIRPILGGLERQLQLCVGEVRRLVDDLRPAVLDELGLIGALRSRAEAFAAPGGSGPQITVLAGPLGELPAAVEVAAYRIATEAMTNAVRHASARRCDIVVTADSVLTLEITDDGTGLPERVDPGVGLSSMRERAEELGGSFTVADRAGGGTRAYARIPLVEP